MKLTPEQRTHIEQARARGERPKVSLTPEQRREYQESVAQEEAGRDENVAMARRLLNDLTSPGLLGDLRRAVARRGASETAELCSLPKDRLEDFLTGDTLSADELDALLGVSV